MDGAPRTSVLIALALIGVVISAYLALFELGAISRAWDPVFGAGTEQVLRSAPARALPVPDALLGVLGYGTEVVLLVCLVVASSESVRRALTVALAAVAAVALLASIGLVGLQAGVVGAWCFLCLASAAVSCAIAFIAIPDGFEALRRRGATPRQPNGASRASRPTHH
jgi:uncharacterized membrane protein